MIGNHQDLLNQWYWGEIRWNWEVGPYNGSFDEDQYAIAMTARAYAQENGLVNPGDDFLRAREERLSEEAYELVADYMDYYDGGGK